jgi:hypothetical protein
MLTRRHINVHDDELCVMCETGGLETINHEPVRSAYQPPASSTFISEQTSHQQPAATSQQYFSFRTNQHQPSATSQPNRLHLFFDCTFARQCWSIILFHWDMSLGIEDRFLKAIREHVIPFFKEVALIAAWYVWKFRKTRYSTEALLVSTSVSQIFFLTVIPT